LESICNFRYKGKKNTGKKAVADIIREMDETILILITASTLFYFRSPAVITKNQLMNEEVF